MRFFLLICITLLPLVSGWSQATTPHGYRYFHHVQNNGITPKRGEAIVANVDVYAGNTLLSSSRKTAAGTYRYDIPGESEQITYFPPVMDAAMMMSIGDSMTILQTVDDNMRKYLPPAEKEAKEIRFEIKMLEIVSLEQKAAAAKALEAAVQQIAQRVQTKARAYATGMLNNEITARPSGLKMLVEEKGKGPAVKQGEAIQVHYYGCLTNGSPFDNSYSRRQPLQFPAGAGQMIAGFDEGVMQLNHGARAYLFIPPALGYGDQEAAGGMIPPNSELVFYIEIL